jgi:hypothetical protein
MPRGSRPRIGSWVNEPNYEPDGSSIDDTVPDGYAGPDAYAAAGPDTYAGPDAYAGPDEYARHFQDAYPGERSTYPALGGSSWDGAPAEDIVDPQEPPDPWDAFAPPVQEPPDGDSSRSRRHREARPGRRVLTPRLAIAGVAVGVLLLSMGVSARILLTGPDTDPPVSPGGVATSPVASGRLGSAAPTLAASASASPSGPPETTVVSVEAEAAEVGSHGQVVSVSGASGGDAVKLSGNRSGTFVRFSGVQVATAGAYRLTIGYFAELDRTGAVTVNGDPDTAQVVNFPSRAAGTVGEVVIDVRLAAGGNEVLVGSSGGAPLFLDGITLTKIE